MKKIALIVGLFALTSCESIQDAISPAAPEAVFSLEKSIRGNVTLKNLSEASEELTVDWGDGETQIFSGTSNTHQYEKDGNYEVIFTVKNKNGKKSNSSSKLLKIDDTAGDFYIYLNTVINDQYIDVTMDGKLLGQITGYIQESLPCGSSKIKTLGGLAVALKPGTYNYQAVSKPLRSSSWNGTFTIENNKCSLKKLVR